MKKLAILAAAMTVGALCASPALAGHYGHYHGHGHAYVSAGVLGFHVPAPYVPVPHIHSFFSISLGLPYFYAAPVYVAPPPVYYAPPPVVVAPIGAAIWIPGHYVWNGGARFYVEGHWSHRHADRYDD